MKRVLSLQEKVRENKHLSLAAKGLFFILDNGYPEFACSYEILKNKCNDSDKEIHSALTDLVAYGYIPKGYLECYINKSLDDKK